MKYALTYWHARSLVGVYDGELIRQSIPVEPEFLLSKGKVWNRLLFSGSVRRFISNRMVRYKCKRSQHLFWSLAQAKRAMEVVPASFVRKALIKHRRAMDTPAGPSSPQFVSSLTDKLDKIFTGIKLKKYDTVAEFSNNACWEQSRANGGAKGYLLHDHMKEGKSGNDELLGMSYDPINGCSETRGLVCPTFHDLVEGEGRRQMSIPMGAYKGCSAMTYPVCEPAKVCVITKGNAYPYAIAKQLQLAIMVTLKERSNSL
jgi:hypothetical protein